MMIWVCVGPYPHRHGRACPGHPRRSASWEGRGCPGQARAWRNQLGRLLVAAARRANQISSRVRSMPIAG